MKNSQLSRSLSFCVVIAIEPDNPHVFLSCGEDSNVLQIDFREDSTQRNKSVVYPITHYSVYNGTCSGDNL